MKTFYCYRTWAFSESYFSFKEPFHLCDHQRSKELIVSATSHVHSGLQAKINQLLVIGSGSVSYESL